uniref:Uncharacterized protein n=1 Tax=Molossus molossus TaxID=27622 RepID=A0A7J8DT57_MOLMO|nr:hypothetical protein HJG59_009106 [Molossus molossus]
MSSVQGMGSMKNPQPGWKIRNINKEHCGGHGRERQLHVLSPLSLCPSPTVRDPDLTRTLCVSWSSSEGDGAPKGRRALPTISFAPGQGSEEHLSCERSHRPQNSAHRLTSRQNAQIVCSDPRGCGELRMFTLEKH